MMRPVSARVVGWIRKVVNQQKAYRALQPTPAGGSIHRRIKKHLRVTQHNWMGVISTLFRVLCDHQVMYVPRQHPDSDVETYFSQRSGASWKDRHVAPDDGYHRRYMNVSQSRLDPNLKQFYFTSAGRLILGLGAFGAVMWKNPNGQAAAGAEEVVDDTVFKRRLFANLSDMFQLDPSPAAAAKAASVSSSPSSSATSWSGSSLSASATASAVATNHQPEEHKEQQQQQQQQQLKQPSAEELAAGKHFQSLIVGDRLVLREGDITRDQWASLSAFLSHCPDVKSLRLQGIEITAEDVEALGKSLCQIRSITFCDNSIGLNEGALESLIAILMCCGMLESTSIIRNSLADEHIPHILQLMTKHSSLTRTSLSYNGITDLGSTLIADQLHRFHARFEELDLSCNFISEPSQQQLLNAAQQAATDRRTASTATAMKLMTTRIKKNKTSHHPVNIILSHNQALRTSKRERFRKRFMMGPVNSHSHSHSHSGSSHSGTGAGGDEPWCMVDCWKKENMAPFLRTLA